MCNDVKVEDFTEYINRCTLPSITVYNNNTLDYKGFYVARLFDSNISHSGPTNIVYVNENLEKVREKIPDGFVKFSRDEDDDDCILETYY